MAVPAVRRWIPSTRFLSFAYSLLAHDCASLWKSVGLDSYAGFFTGTAQAVLPGLDLMEELRPCIADRFVLTLR